VAESVGVPCIYVLAGTNGAGKSSLGGAMLWRKGAAHFDPDEAARRILAANPGTSQEAANSAAWNQGKRLLERAIEERRNFAFETTLGGRTIAALLEKALLAGIEVRIWYVGLGSPELHIKRVRSRVRKGGHDIPEANIRERYVHSLWNLIHLLPKLTEVFVYDNSIEADPSSGAVPMPKLILHAKRRKIVDICDLRRGPNWTKPILMAALNEFRREKKIH
jgi:predicted ABC-type ATPase